MKRLLCLIILICNLQLNASAQAENFIANEIQLQNLWQSLPSEQVYKRVSKDKYVSYIWAHNIESQFGFVTDKIFLYFSPKFRNQFGYNSEFATALLVTVQDKVYILDKIRANRPITFQEWQAIVLKEANERLEVKRKALVRELKRVKKLLQNTRSYGGWIWSHSEQQLKYRIKQIYHTLYEFKINEYAKAKIRCTLLENPQQLKSNSDGSWCYEYHTSAYHFDTADILKSLESKESPVVEWNETSLTLGHYIGLKY